jgi:type I restriction enzyme S subunit
VREAKNFITAAGLENSAAKLFPRDTVLVAMYGATAGQVGILRFEAATNQAVCGILPNDKFVPEFLYYFLLAKKDDLVAQATGNAQPNISQIKIKNTAIPVLPLPEQQRIVALLDEAFEGLATAKANAEQNLHNARTIFESHLQAVFSQRGVGWVDRMLDHVCIVERGSSPRPIKEYFTAEPDGVNWIKIGDTVEGGKYVYSTKQKITPEGAMQSRFVKEGDFILTNSMSYGRPYIMKTTGCIHDGWFVLRLGSSIDADYFFYLLGSFVVQSQFTALASGSVVKNISGDLVKKAVLPIPPLEHHKNIVEKLLALEEETQRLTRIYERKLAALEELKKSLLHQAFNGEL